MISDLIILNNSFTNGLGNAISYFEWLTNVIMTALIFFGIILILIGIRKRGTGYRIFLAIMNVLFLVPVYFCFQHEVQHYIGGTILLLVALIGLLMAFLPKP